MEDDPHTYDRLASVVIKNEEMDQLADYVSRGRRFQELPANEVKAVWIGAFRFELHALLAGSDVSHTELNDISAEIALRGEKEPFEAVMPEAAALVAEIARQGPNERGVMDAVRRFRESLDKPKN